MLKAAFTMTDTLPHMKGYLWQNSHGVPMLKAGTHPLPVPL